MKKTENFQSTLSLLNFLALHEAFVFDYMITHGHPESSFEWKIDGIEDQILLQNADFNSNLESFFYEEIISPNADCYDSLSIQPLIIDKQLVFNFYSGRNAINLESVCKSEIPFSNYVENVGKDNLLPLLNNLLKTDQLTPANFDGFIKFSCQINSVGSCEIFERKSKAWLDSDDFENGEAIHEALNDFYYDSIYIDFDEDQEPEVTENKIMFYKREYFDESSEMIIEVEDLSVFEDEINYVLTIEDPKPIK